MARVPIRIKPYLKYTRKKVGILKGLGIKQTWMTVLLTKVTSVTRMRSWKEKLTLGVEFILIVAANLDVQEIHYIFGNRANPTKPIRIH